MVLPYKIKEAIKTSLALTIVYGIALILGWDKPMWAGVAVVFCSLTTFGQSINKAGMRMLGTLVGALMALAIFTFFVQQQWYFIFVLSLWVGFCTYMMGGDKNKYFWNVCGFVCVVICFDSARDSASFFHIAVLRTEQTALGIFVYSLIALLLWPVRSGEQFKKSVGKLCAVQHQLYRDYFNMVLRGEFSEKTKILEMQTVQALGTFQQLLGAAVIDTSEIREKSRHWQDYKENSQKLSKVLEELKADSNYLKELDCRKMLPALDAFNKELVRRFTQIEGMVKKQSPQYLPLTVTPDSEKVELNELTAFQKVALAVTVKRLAKIEHLTRDIFYNLYQIMGFTPADDRRDRAQTNERLFVFDADRLTSVLQVMFSLWLSYLAMIYISDLPGGNGLVAMTGPLAMIVASMPQLPVPLLLIPAGASIFLAGVLYIFVMPSLSTFLGLGLLLFSVTFFFCFFFSAPKQMFGKAFGIVMFLSIAGIANQQVYSFFAVVNTGLMFFILLLILTCSSYFPFNPRPEKVILRLLHRFHLSCHYLLSTLNKPATARQKGVEAYRKAYHLHVLSMVPKKLAMWGQRIDNKAFPEGSPQELQTMFASVQALGFSVTEIVAVENASMAGQSEHTALVNWKKWYMSLQQVFISLSHDPGAAKKEACYGQLTGMWSRGEKKVRETLDFSADQQLNFAEQMHLYSVLGANRGLHSTLLQYIKSADSICWRKWRKPRF